MSVNTCPAGIFTFVPDDLMVFVLNSNWRFLVSINFVSLWNMPWNANGTEYRESRYSVELVVTPRRFISDVISVALFSVFSVFCNKYNEIGISALITPFEWELSHNFNQTTYFSNISLWREWLFYNQLKGVMNAKNPSDFNHPHPPPNDFWMNFVQMVSFLVPSVPRCFPVWDLIPPLLYGVFPITTSNYETPNIADTSISNLSPSYKFIAHVRSVRDILNWTAISWIRGLGLIYFWVMYSTNLITSGRFHQMNDWSSNTDIRSGSAFTKCSISIISAHWFLIVKIQISGMMNGNTSLASDISWTTSSAAVSVMSVVSVEYRRHIH